MGIKQSDGRFHHAGAICHFPFCMYDVIRTGLHLMGYGINPYWACPYDSNNPYGGA